VTAAEPPQSADDDVNAYVGLTREDAEQCARDQGLFVRSLGPGVMVASGRRSGQINLLVVDGVVARIWMG
jgi:hypothetical protein